MENMFFEILHMFDMFLFFPHIELTLLVRYRSLGWKQFFLEPKRYFFYCLLASHATSEESLLLFLDFFSINHCLNPYFPLYSIGLSLYSEGSAIL